MNVLNEPSFFSSEDPNQWPQDLCEDGQVRPEWLSLIRALQNLSADTLNDISTYISDNIHSRSTLYNAYSDHDQGDVWANLSAIPYVISTQEWSTIEAAIEQRARLMDRVLQDIYGPQDLVRHCLIPPSLVFGQRGYLWPLRDPIALGHQRLFIYAADLGRARDGQWVVLKDRTQAPVGVGYALQNRQVQGSAMLKIFNQLKVQPQSSFYLYLRSQLQGAGQFDSFMGNNTDMVTVLLSPGPHDPYYLEQIFLSRQMGIALVEGSDLTVRDEKVYLKTLEGLKRIHIILRHTDDNDSDPMELSGAEHLGVPGLVLAVRNNNVRLLNALGCSVMESAGVLEFLQDINQHYFGEDLILPSNQSWWCGNPSNFEYVKQHFDELIIKLSYSSQSQKHWYVPDLNPVQKAELYQNILDNPRAYVGQQAIELSTIPEFNPHNAQQIDMNRFTIRVFAVARPEGGYQVMPGGVARVTSDSSRMLNYENRSFNKDVWVCQVQTALPRLAAIPSPELQAIKPLGYQELLLKQTDVPSRMGENLYWLGRYAMRVEYSLLLYRAMLGSVNQQYSAGEMDSLRLLYSLACSLGILPAIPAGMAIDMIDDYILERLRFGLEPSPLPNSLSNNVKSVHSCAFHIREKLSTDTWWLMAQFPDQLRTQSNSLADVEGQITKLYSTCSILSGFTYEQMTRDGGWHFLLMARIMEKLTRSAETIQFFMRCTNTQKVTLLPSLLAVAYSTVTYRARYHREPEMLAVLYLLIFDKDNPYSLVFLINQFLDRCHFFNLADSEDIERIEQVRENLDYIDLSYFDANSPRAHTVYVHVADLCHKIVQSMSGFTEKLSNQYFLINQEKTGGFGLDAMNKEYL